MENIEKISRQKRKKRDIKKIILQTIVSTGMISVALLAPNAIGVMAKLGFIPKNRDEEIIKRTRHQLIKQGLLAYENNFLKITKKGEDFLKHLEISNFQLQKPKRWDNQWRVLIFDIPEKRKNLREKIRRTLISVGFIHLQDSVWIYPYDCEELITLLKADFKIGKDLLYMIVDSLENDKWIRDRFGLNA